MPEETMHWKNPAKLAAFSCIHDNLAQLLLLSQKHASKPGADAGSTIIAESSVADWTHDASVPGPGFAAAPEREACHESPRSMVHGKGLLALQLLLGEEDAMEAKGYTLRHWNARDWSAAHCVGIIDHEERLLLGLVIHKRHQVAIVLACNHTTG